MRTSFDCEAQEEDEKEDDEKVEHAGKEAER